MKKTVDTCFLYWTLFCIIGAFSVMVSCSGGGGGGGDDDDPLVWYQDADGDGYGDSTISMESLDQPQGYVSDNTDCDDTNGDINPGATETYGDGIDQDCDGSDLITFYRDADSDGYGDANSTYQAIFQPEGYVTDDTDCDDTDGTVNPGATETPDDGIDQDCDGRDLKTWYRDSDGDGYGSADDSKTNTTQPQGYVSDNTDCDDTDATINPGAAEILDDGIDQDCDGSDRSTFYKDEDGDGYGDQDSVYQGMSPPEGYVRDNTDCNDSDAAIHPGATEICGDTIDQNCDLLDANCRPTATIEAPATNAAYTVGQSISFSGTATDPEGSALTYKWYFGDGKSSTDQNPTHVYSQEGTFTVGLIVMDDHQQINAGIPTITLTINWPDPVTNSYGMTFQYIPQGTFEMGSPLTEFGRDTNETQHSVTLSSPFYLQSTEVTQGQWTSVMQSNPSSFTGCNDCPVESVSYNDIVNFITQLNQLDPGTYRLPTEAEWEYAARAGATTAFSRGDISNASEGCVAETTLDPIGWYCHNSETMTHPVGSKLPNDWGLYDMHGNVLEWCSDYYTGADYSSVAVVDPIGSATGNMRVIRGGDWFRSAQTARSANRDGIAPELKTDLLGFRLVKEN